MLDKQKLNELAAVSSENCISFYIPTHRVDGIQKDKIRYKNCLSEVRSELEKQVLSPQQIDEILVKAEEKLKDEDFWRHLSDTLAVFIYDGKTEFHTLPVDTEGYHFVGAHLYLLPVLPIAGDKNAFYVLALSQNEVRVFEGANYTFAELEKNNDFPENLAEILRYYDGEPTQQHHNGGESTVFHGQGAGKDVENARLEEYLRKVDKGIETMSCDDDKTPLVLYTTPKLAGVYRKINTYPQLQEVFVEGNPEDQNMIDIHEKTWAILEPAFLKEEEAELDAFDAHLASDKASFDIHTIVPAAMVGQVKTLFLVNGQEIWGKYNAEKHTVEIHEERRKDSRPLYNDIALKVLDQSGTVHVLEREDMPQSTANANAIFYYELATA